MSDPTKFLTVAEVIARLAARGVTVSDETVQRWARTGRVPAKRLRIGKRGRYLFRVEDIDALVDEVAA